MAFGRASLEVDRMTLPQLLMAVYDLGVFLQDGLNGTNRERRFYWEEFVRVHEELSARCSQGVLFAD